MTRASLFACALGLALLPFLPDRGAAQKGAAGADEATPISRMAVRKDFKVERLYSVPRETQGSWVNLTFDPRGRLVVSDQYGKLYRVTPPPIGGKPEDTKVETLDVELGRAHGLCFAFDSLYVVVAEGGGRRGKDKKKAASTLTTGLYRVAYDAKADTFGEVKKLRDIQGGGEHGPHAVIPHPDGKSLVVLAGNHTKLPRIDGSRLPPTWQEDHLLTRMWDANGHARGILAPGGWFCRIDPDGKTWEVISTGYRNQFDAAFNRDGELFTFDSDMEWDMNTPWYRPTRVTHATSGSEFGWRSGSGKWPVYYPDNLPPVVDIGPGSPTGVAFGYGARFPARYQDALYLCDWSYGKLYAVHLKADGASYTGEAEELLSGTPLPLTDLAVSPKDGALYFAIGGRNTQSGLYRITYVGKESTAPSKGDPAGKEARALRRKLEAFHGKKDDAAVKTAWPYLGDKDRFIRYAARVAVEHQDVATWQDKALAERGSPQASLTALLALVRCGDKALQPKVLEALGRIDWTKLDETQKLELLRGYGLAFIRMGKPDAATAAKVIKRFGPLFPGKGRDLNIELCNLLVYLEAPGVAKKALAQLDQALTQEEQMSYALALRELKAGWTMPQRQQYFRWFVKAGGYKGGNSFAGFVRMIKADAVRNLSKEDRATLQPILDLKPDTKSSAVAAKPRPFVKQWTVNELVPLVEKGLVKRDFDKGRRLFAETTCFSCHRFDNEGGSAGPDLTGVSGRFGARDLLESIIEPSKVISDQYAAVEIETAQGTIVTGRIVNLHGETININTDMLNPNAIKGVRRKDIESMKTSKVSMMPEGLIDTLNQEEVLDLMAYLMSRGKRDAKMFK